MATANIEFEKACKVLGLDTRQASVNNINRAYRSLANKYHPDKNPTADPALFVGITNAKNIALKHAGDNARAPAKPATPLKLEIVPGELDFNNVGRREIKSREFIVYSTGGPFTKFSIDRRHLPKWINVSGIARTSSEELPVRVTVRITGPEAGDRHECHIPVKIENRHTGDSAEARVRIKLTMKEPKLQLGCKSFEFQADRHGLPRPQILTLTNTGAGQIKGNLTSHEQWIFIEPAHVSFHDRQLVKIRVDACGQAGRNSGQINVRTNAGEEIITVQAACIPRTGKARPHGEVRAAGNTGVHRVPAKTASPSQGWQAPGTASHTINTAKPHSRPPRDKQIRDIVRVDSRKAALGVTIAASSLFLCSIIAMANTSATTSFAPVPPVQEAAKIEHPGKLLDTAAVNKAPEARPQAAAVNEARGTIIQPQASDLTAIDTASWRPLFNQYWPAGNASSDNAASKPTYPAATQVTTGGPATVQQTSFSATTAGTTGNKAGPAEQVKKKEGKLRHPLQYVDAEGPRTRFNKFTNPGPPHSSRGRDR